jgi:hypothetical protein
VALPGSDARLLDHRPAARGLSRARSGASSGARGANAIAPAPSPGRRGLSEVGWLNGLSRGGRAAGVATPVSRLSELVGAAALDHDLRDRLAGQPSLVVEAVAASTVAP